MSKSEVIIPVVGVTLVVAIVVLCLIPVYLGSMLKPAKTTLIWTNKIKKWTFNTNFSFEISIDF